MSHINVVSIRSQFRKGCNRKPDKWTFKHGNVYELMNGQVWQQIDSSYSLNHLYVPRVAIFERDGYFYMKVYGMDGEVAVQQLE